jgi:hypothetical protein
MDDGNSGMPVGTACVRLSREGLQRVREVAQDSGMSLREYMEALMNYAISTHHRPGSWEGASVFSPDTYRSGVDSDGVPLSFADRWIL